MVRDRVQVVDVAALGDVPDRPEQLVRPGDLDLGGWTGGHAGTLPTLTIAMRRRRVARASACRYHGRSEAPDQRETDDVDDREGRAAADGLGRNPGSHDRQARGGGARGRGRRRAGDVLPGAVLRAVLLPGAGPAVLQLHGADPRRADHEAVPERGEGARDGPGPADVRDRPGRPVLQHRRGDRRRRDVPGQVPQAAHPAGQGLLGEVLLRSRHRRLSGLRDRGRQGRRVHLLRPALPRGLADARPARRRDRVQPVGDAPRALRVHLASRAAGRGRREHVLHRRDQPGRHRAARRRRLLRPELLRRPGGQVRRRSRAMRTSPS